MKAIKYFFIFLIIYKVNSQDISHEKIQFNSQSVIVKCEDSGIMFENEIDGNFEFNFIKTINWYQFKDSTDNNISYKIFKVSLIRNDSIYTKLLTRDKNIDMSFLVRDSIKEKGKIEFIRYTKDFGNQNCQEVIMYNINK